MQLVYVYECLHMENGEVNSFVDCINHCCYSYFVVLLLLCGVVALHVIAFVDNCINEWHLINMNLCMYAYKACAP